VFGVPSVRVRAVRRVVSVEALSVFAAADAEMAPARSVRLLSVVVSVDALSVFAAADAKLAEAKSARAAVRKQAKAAADAKKGKK